MGFFTVMVADAAKEVPFNLNLKPETHCFARLPYQLSSLKIYSLDGSIWLRMRHHYSSLVVVVVVVVVVYAAVS